MRMQRMVAIATMTMTMMMAGCPASPAPRPQVAERQPTTQPTTQVAVDAGPTIDAAVPIDAPVPRVFDFIGDGVPVGFGDVKLGDAMPEIDHAAGLFDGAQAGYQAYTDDGKTISAIGVTIEGDQEVVNKLAKRFGPARQQTWKGPASWLIHYQPQFDYSGMTAVSLVIVPPDEKYVCGRKDGFATFYAKFHRALAAKDWRAVSQMMMYPQRDWGDIEGPDDDTVQLDGPEDFLAKVTSVFRHKMRGDNVVCDLQWQRYHVIYGNERLSPAITVMRVNGQWLVTSVGDAPHDLH